MDTSRQRYELDATGWQRGLYEDIKRTFRAPVVNWVFRTSMATEPEFLRYAWGQLKPVFETEAFQRFSVDYRDAVLSAFEAEDPVPRYRRETLEMAPAEYRELRGQLATFDVVAPRLMVVFCLLDRSLSGGAVGTDPDRSRAATAPATRDLDGSRGTPPTMVGVEQAPDTLSDTLDSIRSVHGLDDQGFPSIYRCLAQWPEYLEPAWKGIEQRLVEGGLDDAAAAARETVAAFVESTPYPPAMGPDALAEAGFDRETISAATDLFAWFNGDIADSIGPVLPLYAATVGAEGRREW